MKKIIVALIIILMLMPGFNLTSVNANRNHLVDDYLDAYGLSSDTTKDEFLDYVIENATIKPWEEELGANATRDDIIDYFFTYGRYMLPEDFGIEVDEDFSGWRMSFYLPIPPPPDYTPFWEYAKKEYDEKGLEKMFPETSAAIRALTTAESLLGMTIEIVIQAASVKVIGTKLPLPTGTGDLIASPILGFTQMFSGSDIEVEPEPEHYGTIPLHGGEYTGELWQDQPHGEGTWVHPEGIKYEGEFKDGYRHGEGTLTHPDGMKYIGQWEYDYEHGHGILYIDGAKYEGDFQDGAIQGNGRLEYPNGHIYDGEWENYNRHGWGVYTKPDGEKYEGEWRNDARNGQGTYIWADGTKYVGEMKNDTLHGEGTLTLPDGRVLSGRFENNDFIY